IPNRDEWASRGAICRGFSAPRSEQPKPTEKPAGTFNARIGPLQRLFGRGCEHDEHARRIRAVLLDQILRIDAVVLRLRHGADAVGLHGLAVGTQYGADALALVVVPDLDVGGVVVCDAAARFPAVE